MSLLTGLKSWFSRENNPPYKELLEELKRMSKNIDELLININTKLGKYNFRKSIEKIKADIDIYNERYQKINSNEYLKKLIVTRAKETGRLFFEKSDNLLNNLRKIHELLRQNKISEENKKDIVRLLGNIESDIAKLKENLGQIEAELIPKQFKRTNAVDPFRENGTTRDEKPISAIIRLAMGFGFEVRKGGSHSYIINLNDGAEGCALGKSTDFNTQVRNRFARAVNRTPQELDAILETI